MTQVSLPPLFLEQAVTGALDPFNKACSQALLGCDAGLVVHNLSSDMLRAAIVFAPEVTLEEAMVMLPTCGIGFQNALGALAPPEVAVHLTWDGLILINGARCGRLLNLLNGMAKIRRLIRSGIHLHNGSQIVCFHPYRINSISHPIIGGDWAILCFLKSSSCNLIALASRRGQ